MWVPLLQKRMVPYNFRSGTHPHNPFVKGLVGACEVGPRLHKKCRVQKKSLSHIEICRKAGRCKCATPTVSTLLEMICDTSSTAKTFAPNVSLQLMLTTHTNSLPTYLQCIPWLGSTVRLVDFYFSDQRFELQSWYLFDRYTALAADLQRQLL